MIDLLAGDFPISQLPTTILLVLGPSFLGCDAFWSGKPFDELKFGLGKLFSMSFAAWVACSALCGGLTGLGGVSAISAFTFTRGSLDLVLTLISLSIALL